MQVLQGNRMGLVGGLASAFFYSAFALLGERAMHRYAPWTVLFYSMFTGAIISHVIYAPFEYLRAGYSALQWQYISYIVVVGTVFPFGLYFFGINYIRSTRAMITATLEPIAAGVIAFFYLGEVFGPWQIIGLALVIGAIVLLQLNQESDALAPARIRK